MRTDPNWSGVVFAVVALGFFAIAWTKFPRDPWEPRQRRWRWLDRGVIVATLIFMIVVALVELPRMLVLVVSVIGGVWLVAHLYRAARHQWRKHKRQKRASSAAAEGGS